MSEVRDIQAKARPPLSRLQQVHFKNGSSLPMGNNCVGIRNQKFFFLFLGYSLAVCVYASIMIVKLMFSPAPPLPGDPSAESELGVPDTPSLTKEESAIPSLENPPSVNFALAAFVVALCGGGFLVVMMKDQLKSLCKGESLIDRMKRQQEDDQSEEQNNTGSFEAGSPSTTAESKRPRSHLWLRRRFPQHHFPEVF
eukprot:CAMPEP_0195514406 /NCGR_PEP_ID=MMETSP0794_2-20130614/5806_1 /TAXON_ID=515487 /ORGANISM="Stephanopyxis turris, Strain CCMP 815" /LENGTH=196 /DNA_ID=CAMNT_0040642649 /DNA_START=364 /DNA_END=952 /DNA_ORIENTATION=+